MGILQGIRFQFLWSLDAKLKLKSLSGERMVAMEGFSKDILEVDLEPDEMLIEIQVPVPKSLILGMAHEKLMVMQGDAGIVGAAVSITLKPGNGICEDARIVVSNAASIPLRAKEAEEMSYRKSDQRQICSPRLVKSPRRKRILRLMFMVQQNIGER